MFFGGSDEDDGSAFSVGMPTQQRSGYDNYDIINIIISF